MLIFSNVCAQVNNKKLSSDIINDLCSVPYSYISDNFKNPIDKVYQLIELGFNEEYVLNTDKKILDKKMASVSNANFFNVDLNDNESLKKIEKTLQSNTNTINIFYIDSLPCAEYSKYKLLKQK